MNITIRRAAENELDLLEKIEKTTFSDFQQSNRQSLHLSLKSSFQQVWVAEKNENSQSGVVGSMILHLHKKSVRIYSIGILPEYMGTGYGKKLLQHAENLALSAGLERILLEADASNSRLIGWYRKAGYEIVKTIPDYYCKGKDAVKMVYELPGMDVSEKTTNIVVVDKPADWNLQIGETQVISASDYISGKENVANRKARIFNLCNSYRYQSLGYYVSLLASARDQRAIPNVTTIRDFKDVSVIRSIADDMDELIQKTLPANGRMLIELNVYFGQTKDEKYKILARKLYQMFESPLFMVQFIYLEKWEIKKLKPLSLSRIPTEDFEVVRLFAKKYFESKRFEKSRLKNYKYFLAVLVNPEESNPPSNKKALKYLKEAAEKADIYPEFITREDYNKICEYDALFIRETTNVNNYTYQFARKAYAEGLIVIDDPWSILRCSNKIFLHERLQHNSIRIPHTVVLNKESDLKNALKTLAFPLVLKQPDSAFSLGVTKIKNDSELKSKLKELFKKSELVLAQEFLPTEYDWRIGVLDNQPLFACKYFMAKDHWQIYNWSGKPADREGNFTTMPVEQVPSRVLETALKAAALVGDGLYGVDLKEIGNKVYVIEVNDNPNIDGGVEDKVLGRKLYERVIKSFVTRIEMSRNIERFVSIAPD